MRKTGVQTCALPISIFNFEADVLVHDSRIDVKLGANFLGEGLRIARFQQDYIASNLAGKRLGRAEGNQVAFVQNGQAIAAFGFFHQMSGNDDGDALLVAENLEVLPKITPRAGIEPSCGLIEEQNLGMMK